MEQLQLFSEGGQSNNLPAELLEYYPRFFDQQTSNALLNKLIATTPWEQREVTMYGKKMLTPRLTAWYGDKGTNYSFTGLRHDPLPWTADLLMIKQQVEPLAGISFNSVLLNYYRDGNDSVAWHSDNEDVLGERPVIASVSFGQARAFDIRNKQDHRLKYSIHLENGSFLLMKGGLQANWEHRIAKSTLSMKPRINLTFRVIV